MVQTCGLSDHRVQLAIVIIPLYQLLQGYIRFVNVIGIVLVIWHGMSAFDDKRCFFHSILNECLNTLIPLKTVRSKKSKQPTSWFTAKIADKIKLKDRAKRHFVSYN